MTARCLRIIAILALAACPALAADQQTPPPAATEAQTAPPAPPEAEPELTPEEKADADIGKSASEELEKEFRVAKDSPAVPRIAAVVEAIRPFTQKPKQVYHIKVLEDRAINALSLPGGYLYFTQGLLDAVESDDELAAVAAHEMAHICLSHSRRLMNRDKRYTTILGSVVLAAILGNSDAVNPGAIAAVGSLVVRDAINHYGQEAEQEADQQAVLYLRASRQYNPVAVLTVVEGLARIESSEGSPELGIEKTHPYGRERAEAVTHELQQLGVPIERRRVTKSLVAEAGSVTQGERAIGELRLNGRVVYQPAVAVDGASPVARAQQSADLMNSLLLANLELLEVTMIQNGSATEIDARGQRLLLITPEDAEFHQATVADLSRKAMQAIGMSFAEERVRRAY
ncbi:MAG: M48 family metallopeptidase [Armatimonadota bacterium]